MDNTTLAAVNTTTNDTWLTTDLTTANNSRATTIVTVTDFTTEVTSPVSTIIVSGCESLVKKGLILSTVNASPGTVVQLSCDEFGHRPSFGIRELTCLSTNEWSHPVPSCEWSWNLTTQEKIIFGTAVAAGSFIVIVIVAVLVACFCCYKKKKDDDKRIYDSSYHGSSPRATGYDGPYQENDSYQVTYLAYQDPNNSKGDSYVNTGTIDKPWLGYIPRPKLSEDRFGS